MVVIEGLGKRLIRESRRDAGHAFIHARRVLVFLKRLGLGIGVAQLLAVIDAHLGIKIGVLVFLQSRQNTETTKHFQRFRCARRLVELTLLEELSINLNFIGHP